MFLHLVHVHIIMYEIQEVLYSGPLKIKLYLFGANAVPYPNAYLKSHCVGGVGSW